MPNIDGTTSEYEWIVLANAKRKLGLGADRFTGTDAWVDLLVLTAIEQVQEDMY